MRVMIKKIDDEQIFPSKAKTEKNQNKVPVLSDQPTHKQIPNKQKSKIQEKSINRDNNENNNINKIENELDNQLQTHSELS
jgi:hypothetical protein